MLGEPLEQESGGLQSMRLERVKHNWSDLAQRSTEGFIYQLKGSQAEVIYQSLFLTRTSLC